VTPIMVNQCFLRGAVALAEVVGSVVVPIDMLI
jgi:hypothetical protein